MKTNVQVQRREIKSYVVEPWVCVDNGEFQVIIDKDGLHILKWDDAAMLFSRYNYSDKATDLKIVELALQWWKEIQ